VTTTFRHSRLVWFSTTTVPSFSSIGGRVGEHVLERRDASSRLPRTSRHRRRGPPAIRI
jgi:hypothetical protein